MGSWFRIASMATALAFGSLGCGASSGNTTGNPASVSIATAGTWVLSGVNIEVIRAHPFLTVAMIGGSYWLWPSALR